MMREDGQVLALDGNMALVKSIRKSACGSCHSKSSCTSFSVVSGEKEVRIKALNVANAQPGDLVILEFSERTFLRASFVIYILPLFVMLGFGILAYHGAIAWGLASNAEGLAGLASIASLAFSFWMLKLYNSHLENDSKYQPVISRIAYQSLSCDLA